MEQAKKLSLKLIENAKKQSENWSFEKFDLSEFKKERDKGRGKGKTMGTKVGKCKNCDGDVVDKGTFYGCSNYSTNKCDFTISKKILGKTISQINAKKLFKDGKTDTIKGFKKGEKTFDAKLKYTEGKIQFLFEK